MAALRQLFPLGSLLTATSPLQTSLYLHQLTRPITTAALVIPLITRFDVPAILAELWESVLRAVPKKKTSHRKKRQRFLAGKALKDVTALNKCSACGNAKRAHLLCPFCVEG